MKNTYTIIKDLNETMLNVTKKEIFMDRKLHE